MSIGKRIRRVEPSPANSDGIWELNEISDYISENKWPNPPLSPINPVVLGNAYTSILSSDNVPWDLPVNWQRVIVGNSYISNLYIDNVPWDLPVNWQRVIVGNSYISNIYIDPI